MEKQIYTYNINMLCNRRNAWKKAIHKFPAQRLYLVQPSPPRGSPPAPGPSAGTHRLTETARASAPCTSGRTGRDFRRRAAGPTPRRDAAGRLEAELGVGALGRHGVVTPYAGGLSDGGGQTCRMGTRFRLGPSFALGLEETRREAANDEAPDHGLMLRGSLRWQAPSAVFAGSRNPGAAWFLRRGGYRPGSRRKNGFVFRRVQSGSLYLPARPGGGL